MLTFLKKHRLSLIIGSIVFAIVLILCILIPVEVYSGKSNNKDNDDHKKPYDPSQLSYSDKSRINCFLEEGSKFENLTRYSCEQRGCVYKNSEYERVPSCFFNQTYSIGYFLDETSNETNYRQVKKFDYFIVHQQ